jgi:hypothetical protein
MDDGESENNEQFPVWYHHNPTDEISHIQRTPGFTKGIAVAVWQQGLGVNIWT